MGDGSRKGALCWVQRRFRGGERHIRCSANALKWIAKLWGEEIEIPWTGKHLPHSKREKCAASGRVTNKMNPLQEVSGQSANEGRGSAGATPELETRDCGSGREQEPAHIFGSGPEDSPRQLKPKEKGQGGL